MNENELLECLSVELESIAETLILIQKTKTVMNISKRC
mgnify:CR=1 FL=1